MKNKSFVIIILQYIFRNFFEKLAIKFLSLIHILFLTLDLIFFSTESILTINILFSMLQFVEFRWWKRRLFFVNWMIESSKHDRNSRTQFCQCFCYQWRFIIFQFLEIVAIFLSIIIHYFLSTFFSIVIHYFLSIQWLQTWHLFHRNFLFQFNDCRHDIYFTEIFSFSSMIANMTSISQKFSFSAQWLQTWHLFHRNFFFQFNVWRHDSYVALILSN